MTAFTRTAIVIATAVVGLTVAHAQAVTKVDLSQETVGKQPQAFEPEMGMWVVAQDGPDKVIKVDGAAFKQTLSTPERLLLDNARKLYGTTNEDLMDNAKQFTVYPVAVLKNSPTFSDGTISVKFKTISGDADRASGILFNLKPNGDWLCVRYNDTENNVGLWEFHHGVRRLVKVSDRTKPFMLDKAQWHDLVLTVAGPNITVTLDGAVAVEWVLGTTPGPGRNGAAPNPDLFAENNPVLKAPVSGKVGLWSKTDSTVLFKDYVINSR